MTDDPIFLLLVLLIGHFVGDFLCQSDWMATNKSKSWYALLVHVLAYTPAIFVAALVVAPEGHGVERVWWAWNFTAITAWAHLLTDAVTSRWTSRLWFFPAVPSGTFNTTCIDTDGHLDVAPTYYTPIPENRHWFFVVIGFDQLLHAMQIGVTLRWLLP